MKLTTDDRVFRLESKLGPAGEQASPAGGCLRRSAIQAAFSLLVSVLSLAWSVSGGAQARIDAAGRISVDGRAVFLHGMYHDSMDAVPMRYGPDFRIDAERIATAGFNTIWVSLDPTFGPTVAKDFSYLGEKGLYIISSFYLQAPEAVLPLFAGIDSLVGVSIGDDFNYAGASAATMPQALNNYRGLVNRHVPGVITLSSGGAHPALPIYEYGSAMDAMGLQCYPISNTRENVPGGEPYELEMCDDMFTFVRETLGNRYPILPTLQAFKWQVAGSRYPTPQEVRNMFYTTIQYNPAGIVWYSYYHDGQTLLADDQPALWQELSMLARDLDAFDDILLRGEFEQVKNPDDPYMTGADGAWHAAFWEMAEATLLIVTNTDRSRELDVDFPLPGKSEMRSVFDDPRYADTLRYDAGRVSGDAPPDSIQVYLLFSEGAELGRTPNAPLLRAFH